MKNKIIALVLVIPLLFIFTIYSFTTSASINIAVSASSITIDNKPDSGNVYLDLGDSFVIEATVYPTQASVRTYTVSVAVTEGDDDCITASDNTVTANGIGRATVTVSTNNGFTDSFVVIATSDKAVSFASYIYNSDGDIMSWDSDFDLGTYTIVNVINPVTATADIEYSTSDSDIATVTVAGKLTIVDVGIVTVTVTLPDGATGSLVNEYTIKTAFPNSTTGVVVGGSVDNATLSVPMDTTLPTSYSTTLIVDTTLWTEEFDSSDITLYVGGTQISSSCYTIVESTSASTMSTSQSTTVSYKVVFDFQQISTELGLTGSFAIDIYILGYDTDYTFSVTLVEHDFDMHTTLTVDGSSYILGNSYLIDDTADNNGESATVYLTTDNYTDHLEYEYNWYIVGSSVSISGSADGASCKIVNNGTSIANSILYVSVSLGDSVVYSQSITITPIKITTIAYTSGLTASSSGISSTRAAVTGTVLPIEINGVSASKVNWDILNSFITISSSSRSIATIDSSSDPTLTVVNSGYVTITASYGQVSSSIELYAVKDGVEVSTSQALFSAVEAGKAVVLTSSIMLGDHMTVAERTEYLKSHTFVSTYNTVYIDNWNSTYPANQLSTTLSYILDITNNIYGNGYTLSAELFNQMPTEDGYTGQTGALDYISVSFGGAEIHVYGQDNVSFLMRTDGVVIDNVDLCGRDSDSLITEEGYLDLSRLDYAGTVVDINASVSINNSRIYNGKNVVRVYGGNSNGDSYHVDYNQPLFATAEYPYATTLDKDSSGNIIDQITVDINSCRMFNGREFVLKIGSNKAASAADEVAFLGTYDTGNNKQYDYVSTMFYNYDTNLPLIAGAVYSDSDQQYFMNNYVTTIVNVHNSLLYDSGLMVVGLESQFSGQALISTELGDTFTTAFASISGDNDFVLNWQSIGGTSYASVLNLTGTTNIYAWKDVDSVDTDSLINIVESGSEDIDKYLAYLDFDIGSMILSIDDYEDMTVTVDGTTYAYCGICMYGGGYNYSQVNVDSTSPLYSSTMYSVNLSELEYEYDIKGLLATVAGTEDFRFYMQSSSGSYNMSAESSYRDTDSIVASRLG